MGEINIMVGEDYPLTGSVVRLEECLFVTAPLCVAEHAKFCGAICIINGTNMVDCSKELSGFHDGAVFCATGLCLNDREQLLKTFNRLGQAKIPAMGSYLADGLGFVTIDLESKICSYTLDDLDDVLQNFRNIFVKWCHDNNRFGGFFEHLTQNNKCPHIHILYERGEGRYCELGYYLRNM